MWQYLWCDNYVTYEFTRILHILLNIRDIHMTRLFHTYVTLHMICQYMWCVNYVTYMSQLCHIYVTITSHICDNYVTYMWQYMWCVNTCHVSIISHILRKSCYTFEGVVSLHVHNPTHSNVRHDAIIFVTWHLHMCDMTQHGHMCDMPPSYVWHASFICVTCHFHMCDMQL